MIFENQEIKIINGKMKNKTGIFKRIIDFKNLVNNICSIEIDGKIYTEKKENFVFINKELELKWNLGDIKIENIDKNEIFK